jgi:acyl carrier protein
MGPSGLDRETLRLRLAHVLEVPPAELTDDFLLTGDRWDSLAILGTIALLDEELGLSLPADELAAHRSVGELLESIARAAAGS